MQLPDQYGVDQQAIERRRQMAQALMQQSQQPLPNGQMVGRVFVGTNPLQHLAQGLRGYSASKQLESADADQKALAGRQQARNQQDMQGVIAALRGTPSFQTPANEMGDETVMQNAVPPDKTRAMTLAMGSQNPGLQQVGAGLMKELTAGPKWEKVELPNPDGSKRVGYVNTNSPNPLSTFQSGGTAPVKMEMQNTGGAITPLNPYTQSAPVPVTGNPFKDTLVAGPGGNPVPNAPLISAKKEIAAAGKPVVSVDARNYNTQESEQSKVYGKSLGEMRATINQGGFDAPKKMAQLDRMEQLLAGIDGGGAAPAMAEIASVAQSLGIKIDPKLGNKQAAEALSREMAGGLRQPGTGPMTDKDFDNFLKQVPSLSKTAEGRAQITKTLRASIERDARAAQFAREYAKANKGVIDDNFFDAVSDFYAKNPIVSPAMPATNARGMAFDGDKEKRYQDWLKSQGQK